MVFSGAFFFIDRWFNLINRSLTEPFAYDAVNRLTGYGTHTYDSNEN